MRKQRTAHEERPVLHAPRPEPKRPEGYCEPETKPEPETERGVAVVDFYL